MLPPLVLVRFENKLVTLVLFILIPALPYVFSALLVNDVVPEPLCCSKEPRPDACDDTKVTSLAFVMIRLTLGRSSWLPKTMFSSAISVRVGVYPFVVLDSGALKLIEPQGLRVGVARQSFASVLLAVVIVTLMPESS